MELDELAPAHAELVQGDVEESAALLEGGACVRGVDRERRSIGRGGIFQRPECLAVGLMVPDTVARSGTLLDDLEQCRGRQTPALAMDARRGRRRRTEQDDDRRLGVRV